MDPLFISDKFVIKRKGFSTSKFRICSSKGDLLFYVEEKIQWTSPFKTTIRFYSDEEKTREILSAQDGKHEEYSNFLEVSDPATNQKIGGVGGDWNNFFEDAWAVVDAGNQPICTLRESSTGRALLSQLTDGLVSQKLDFQIGQEVVGELRQKAVLIGHQLLVDFSKDAVRRVDRRLGLVAAVVIAAHQATTEAD
jgi:hypothetical protein